MPSLKELSDKGTLDAFVKSVVSGATRMQDVAVDVNNGIKTTQELNDHLEKGWDVPFDYQRMIDDAKTY